MATSLSDYAITTAGTGGGLLYTTTSGNTIPVENGCWNTDINPWTYQINPQQQFYPGQSYPVSEQKPKKKARLALCSETLWS